MPAPTRAQSRMGTWTTADLLWYGRGMGGELLHTLVMARGTGGELLPALVTAGARGFELLEPR